MPGRATASDDVPAWRALRALALLLPLALAACVPQPDRGTVHGFRQSVAQGNFLAATNMGAGLAGVGANGRGTELLWSMNAGAAALHA